MFFQCFYISRVSRKQFEPSAWQPRFKQLPRTTANVNALKKMYDPYIMLLSNIATCVFLLVQMPYYVIIMLSLFQILNRDCDCSRNYRKTPTLTNLFMYHREKLFFPGKNTSKVSIMRKPVLLSCDMNGKI